MRGGRGRELGRKRERAREKERERGKERGRWWKERVREGRECNSTLLSTDKTHIIERGVV